MKPAASNYCLSYASAPRARRRRISPLICEVLEFLLALMLLAAILALMTAGMVTIILRHWLLAGLAFTAIPVVIIVCFEASETLRRRRERLI
jgi:hypothetical protein